MPIDQRGPDSTCGGELEAEKYEGNEHVPEIPEEAVGSGMHEKENVAPTFPDSDDSQGAERYAPVRGVLQESVHAAAGPNCRLDSSGGQFTRVQGSCPARGRRRPRQNSRSDERQPGTSRPISPPPIIYPSRKSKACRSRKKTETRQISSYSRPSMISMPVFL